jgi:HK97 family phage prohead protease
MTEALIEQATEARESGLLRRTFEAELTPGDGRTLDVRVVPYNTPAQVSDGGPVYREEWADGSFDDQLVAGHRLKVLMNFEHHQGFADLIGKGLSLRSAPDGLHGSFRVRETEAGDLALELVRDGILDGISLEARAKKSIRTAEGVVRRVRAHLHNVALCRTPAFADARVLAVREQPEILMDEELLPVPIDPEVVERCRRLGVALPAHLQAHPVDTGTPAPSGTPEDDTRRDSHSTSSEVSAP